MAGPRDEDGILGHDARKTKAELIAELEALRALITKSGSEQDHQALRESEERYRIVTEISRDVVTVTDESGSIIFASPAMEAVFGFKPGEMLGTPFQAYLDLIHPDDRDRYGLTQE